MVDGVPVVVAVDEGGVHGGEAGQHLVADVAVEHESTRELPLERRGIELGGRIDHVELGVGAQMVEHQPGGLAAQRADLEDSPGSGGLEGRSDDVVPERKHGDPSASCAVAHPTCSPA